MAIKNISCIRLDSLLDKESMKDRKFLGKVHIKHSFCVKLSVMIATPDFRIMALVLCMLCIFQKLVRFYTRQC